jgi:hypothetical protein
MMLLSLLTFLFAIAFLSEINPAILPHPKRSRSFLTPYLINPLTSCPKGRREAIPL